MIKTIKCCDKCNHEEIIGYNCDMCGEFSHFPEPFLSLTGESEYNFCGLKCMHKFISLELQKENNEE